MRELLKHYTFNYILAGIILGGLLLCIRDFNTAEDVLSKLINLFFGVINFTMFIYHLLYGIIKQLKDYFNEHPFTVNYTDNTKNNKNT